MTDCYALFETSISLSRQSCALPSLIEASASLIAEAKFPTRPPAIIAADAQWEVSKNKLVSKSKNSCFLGRKLKGRVEYTIYNGNIVYPFSYSQSPGALVGGAAAKEAS